ncbi:MAG: DUF1926 domain-containing protein [bacterium]|nr:DUF1926 domain-containing protein [bacterium]
MKAIQFIFGVHNHQPVGNFDFVFEEAYQKAYNPFLRILEGHPRIRMMYHTTGPLLDWLSEHHPDFLQRLQILAARKQIEIMTGGYYEPILAVLPDRDKQGQIRMMNEFIRKQFKTQPQGLWLAERVWEPHLPKSLAECEVKYVTVDDYHFLSSGMNLDELLGYYLTDEQGYSLGIYPISQKLRYLIPFAPVEDSLNFLRSAADFTNQNLLVMCDDGEKFGLWPGTYEWIYEKGWLQHFFELLETAMGEGWLSMTTCAEYYDANPPRGRVYLPCASYFEMSAWSLPPQSGAKFDEIIHRLEKEQKLDELKPYLKGGFWRNFIGKYEESNQMYRKALWISDLIDQIGNSDKITSKDQRKKLTSAQRALYRAQCNCAYWHGVFGGLYLPHLRHAIYANLLEAEELCNDLQHQDRGFTVLEKIDVNADGHEEILLRNGRVGLILTPDQGGSMVEFDFLPVRYNLLNTLHRQPEAYHQQVARAGEEIKEGASIHDQLRAKEEGLDKFLIYDRHLRGSSIDHFISAQESPETLYNGKYYELGDFVGKPYKVISTGGRSGKSVQLGRIGAVVDNQIEVRKTISLLSKADGIGLDYQINNMSDLPLTILFAPEFNFALLGGNAPDRYYHSPEKLDRAPLNSMGIVTGAKRFSMINEYDRFGIHFEFTTRTEVWRYAVETVSQSEGGFERVYQSSCVLPIFRLVVPPFGKTQIKFKIVLEMLN